MSDAHPITCVECQSRLVEFALDELGVEHRAPIEEHLVRGCAVCNERLAETLNEFATLALALPTDRPGERVERELFGRIAGQDRKSAQLPRMGDAIQSVAHKTPSRGLMAAALVLAASIVGIALWSNWNRHSESAPASLDDWANVRRRVESANAADHFAAIPHLKFASLRKPAAEPTVEGYLVVDQSAKQWHVYAFHLPALAAGRNYLLWFDMEDGRFVRAGKADVDDEGSLASLIDVPAEVVNPKGLAISDEAEAAPEQPTGENVVVAPLR